MEIAPISASMGAMGSLAEKLDGLMDSELKDEIWKLKTRLYDLSKIWDPPLTARRWMKDVRGLSYEMENCVDAETDWFHKISRFKVRAKDSNGRYDRYDLQDVLSHTNHIEPIVGHRLPAVDGDREPDPVVRLHGEGGTVDRLSHLLTDGDEQLKVLSIIGVGGIGKTTLAKELWRKHKPGNHFHCRAFVPMAKKPDMRRILRSILAQVRPNQPPDADEVQELIEDIREHLQDKRYFLIIDDLWATSVWDVARRAFPEGKGSRILTMTEIEDVALACCSYQSDYFFEMNPLSDSHSKELFTSAVFGSVEEYSSQLDEMSDEIIRRCAGLPQAIISVSSVLASQWEAYTVQNMEEILKNLPTNTTPNNILKQVLNICYNYLPSSLQTCLLYLSMYPENYIFLKEDIMKQWVAEGFILAPTDNEKMKVAGNYFDKLVKMGLIQHIDVDYTDEVLYYLVNHMVHDFITSKAIEENFISVIDYLQRTLRLSNKVSRLSVQFGSATYATTLPSVGLSQVRSLAFIGLKNCLPSISEFKVLRSLILHIWADQPSTGVDLKPTSKLVLLRSMQVTCNGTVHLPDLMQGPKNLETLEINAIVAAIPANIVHLRNWLHLRLGVGTELPDLTGILRNVTLNAPILLDELSSPADTVTSVELLSPISRIPKWTRQLINLCILKLVVKELQMDDINKLQKLPFLTILSLHVQRRTTEVIDFTPGEFVTLEYFEFRCSVLRLMFQKGTMPNLQRLRLGFNACRGEQYGCQLAGIEHLSNVQEIYGIIGSVAGAQEDDLKAAEHAFKEAIGLDHRNFNMKRVDTVEEEYDHTEKQYVIREKNASIKQPAVLEQDSKKDINQNASSGEAAEHAFKEATGEDHSNVNMKIVDMVEEEYGHTDKQQVIREKDASVKQPALLEQDSKKDIKQNASSGSQLIQRNMTPTMAVSASTGVMNSLLGKLTTLMGDEYRKLKGVRNKVASLHEEFSSMNALLVKLAGMDELDVQAKVWRDQVRDMSYDIEDCIDDFMHDLEVKGATTGFLKKTTERLKKLKVRHQIANEIKGIEAHVHEMHERRIKYKLDEYCPTSSIVHVDPRALTIFADAAGLVGIDSPRAELIELLMDQGQELKVASIVGFGGLGKTTLASEVCRKIEGQFTCHAFVSVSLKPDIPKLLQNLLFKLTKQHSSQSSSLDDVIRNIREYLLDKRYFIVIDDLWDTSAWDVIKCAFPENNHGSRVLTTTRIYSVAAACCSKSRGCVYKMKSLKDHDSRKLFFSRIFGSEDSCPTELEDVSIDILKKCGGLPLAIISVSSLLADQPKQTFEYVRKSLGYMFDGNTTLDQMRQILELSFRNLPNHLKTCMLYLGMYPGDHEIYRVDLLRQWIAEGFICAIPGLDAEDVAISYFNELINRSMIQPVKTNVNREVLSCRVHDILLDVIRSKIKEDNFISVLNDPEVVLGMHGNIRRASLQCSGEECRLRSAMVNGSLSKVRSVYVFGGFSCQSLMLLKYVRVLHLDISMNDDLDLTGISRLFLLRYLKVIGDTKLELPSQIGKLQQLETLDLEESVCKLPSDIASLPLLLHLIVHGGTVFPDGIGRLRLVRTLGDFDIWKNSVENIKGLGEMNSLRDFDFRWSGNDLGEGARRMDILRSSLERISGSLRTLTMYFGGYGYLDAWSTLSPPPIHLREMWMWGCIFSTIPKWFGHLRDLQSLIFKVRGEGLKDDGVAILAGLPSLVCLSVCAVEPLKERVHIPGSAMAFRTLEEFDLECYRSLLTFEAGAMPMLKKLFLRISPRDCESGGSVEGPLLDGIEHLPAGLRQIHIVVSGEGEGDERVRSSLKVAFEEHHPSAALEIQ